MARSLKNIIAMTPKYTKNDNYGKDFISAFNKIYEKMLELDYFDNPIKIFPPAFNPDLENRTLNNESQLPLFTTDDFVNYSNQCIFSSFLAYFLVSLVILSTTDLPNHIFKIMIKTQLNKENLVIEGVDEEKAKEAILNMLINKKDELLQNINNKPISKRQLKMANSIIQNILIHHVIINGAFERVFNVYKFLNVDTKNKDFVKDPLMTHIMELFKKIIEENPNLKKEYKRIYKFYGSRGNYLSEFISKLKVKYLKIKYSIKINLHNFISWLTFSDKYVTIENYKDEMLHVNPDVQHYQKKFVEMADNLNRLTDMYSNLFKSLFKAVYEFNNDEITDMDNFNKYFSVDVVEETIEKIINLNGQTMFMIQSVIDTTREILIRYAYK